MYQRVKKYTSIFSMPVLAVISLLGSQWLSYLLPFMVFFWIPLVELFTEQSRDNFTEEQEKKALADPFYDRLLYVMVPIQLAVVFLGLYILKYPEVFFINIHVSEAPVRIFGELNFVSGVTWTRFEIIGKIFSIGICCGVIGINLGHELGHRVTRFERFLAKTLLLTSMYMHFIIEHNRGHHNRVATDEDPATARRGEILYFFWIRSIIFGYISAWKLEMERLKKMEIPFFSLKNEMIQFVLIQGSFAGLIFILFGLKGMIFFLLAALIGGLLLETVNYIEHYGLQRIKNKVTNTYEKVFPTHSWNSNHKIGRIYLFELTRHSDHHYVASRKYQILRHFDESPQMPFGYPSMMVIATIPPLWFFVMHRHIEKHKQLLATRNRFAS